MAGALPLSIDEIDEHNTAHRDALEDDYTSLGRQLERRGVDIDVVKRKVADFSVALPTWGVGRGGTRFAKFPIPGEPTNIHEKLEDCAVVQQLSRATPRVSPHFPWDFVDDYDGLREEAAALGLGGMFRGSVQVGASQGEYLARRARSSQIYARRSYSTKRCVHRCRSG